VSDAEAVVVAEVRDDDGEADPGCDGETGCDGEADCEGAPEAGPEPDAEGDVADDAAGDAGAVLLGALLRLAADAEAAAECEGETDGVGDCVGVGVGVAVGVGVGEGVLEAGSAWHLVSVFALALVEVPALGVTAASPSAPARAVPGTLASTPRIRKPPATELSAATRTCARRMRIALSTLLIRLCVLFMSSEETRGRMGINTHIRCWPSYACTRIPDHGRAALAGRRPGHQV
jgi:hypothetical protein